MAKQIELFGNQNLSSSQDHTDQHRPPKLDTSQFKNISTKWSEYKMSGKNILIRSYSAACAVGANLYVYGGMQILNGILKDFHEVNLDPKNQHYQWKEVVMKDTNCTPGPRAKHGMAAFGRKIYLFGGITDHNKVSNQIFCFDLDEARWLEIKPKGNEMPYIDSFGYTSNNKKIYVVCGYDGKNCKHLNSVYEYDIETNTGTMLFEDHPQEGKSGKACNNSVPAARSNSAVAIEGSKLYLFGGKTEVKRLNDIWVFDIESKKYTRVQDHEDNRPMLRSGHTLNNIDGNLFILGGIHEVTWQLDDLHIFNTKTNRWTVLEVDSARRKDQQLRTSEKDQKDQKDQEKKPIQMRKKDSNFYDTFMGGAVSPSKVSHSPSPSTRANAMFQFTKEADANVSVSPGKMIDQQRKKAFLAKKTQMLKVFDVPEKDKARYFNIEPVTQAMRNSLDIIGNPNPKGQPSPTNKLTQFGKTTCSHFLEPLTNNVSLIYGKKPCARDGHNAVVVQNSLIVFGGDRHQMSFNDLYKLDLALVKKEFTK